MQKGYAKKLYALMASVAATMFVAGFGNLKAEEEPESAQDSAISLADVRHGEIFIPEEQTQSLLLIDVTKAGRVSISDVAMTKARLFAEIEKRVEKNGKDFSVTIAVDKEAQYEDVAKVLDLCVDAGVRVPVSFLGMRNRRSGILSTLEARLPDSGQDRSPVAMPITIQIGPDRQGVRVNGTFVPFGQLGSDLKEQGIRSSDATALLACLPDAPHENLMRVLDICRECRVTCRLAEEQVEKEPLEKKKSIEEAITPIKICIGPDTRGVIFGNQYISFEGLDRCIQKLSEESTETPVLLSCTLDSSHGSLVRVLDICYKYKMYKLAVLSM